MALERALKTKDIVLFNVAAIVGMRWIALAAANGPSSLFLWVLAAIVFFIPQGFAVTALSSAIPEEGGLYVWTSKAFGQRQGFLAGWLYWASNITYFPTLTLSTVVFALYIFGTRFAALGACTVLAIAVYSLQVVKGFGWTWNTGGYEYPVFWALASLAVAMEAWKGHPAHLPAPGSTVNHLVSWERAPYVF